MNYVVKKGKKFMEGHSYCNIRHIGYKFSWTLDESLARRFDDRSVACHFAMESNGKAILSSVEAKS